MRIPTSAILSGDIAQQILGVDLDPEVALCALLASARADAEAGGDVLGLREYLLMLPSKFESLPLCMTNSEIAVELSGTALLPATVMLQNAVEKEWQLIVEALSDHSKQAPSEEEVLWAKAVLLTRAGPNLGIEHASSDKPDRTAPGVAIVPLVDFANCAASPSAECKLCTSNELLLVAKHSLAPGEEVTISYGEQTQEQLLFTFGFLLPEAPIVATAPLLLQHKESALRHAMLRLLAMDREVEGSIGDTPLARLRWVDGDVDVSELWAAANIYEMSDDELRKVASASARESPGYMCAVLGKQTTVGARIRLRGLLDEWEAELSVQEKKSFRRKHLAPLQAYRTQCRHLVQAAQQRLLQEEAMALP